MLGSVVVCINLCMALTGEALLTAVDQFKGLPRAEIVRRCGYVNVGESGQERLNNTAFFEALLQAKRDLAGLRPAVDDAVAGQNLLGDPALARWW